MTDQTAIFAPAGARASTATIFGQVMFLVAIAIGFLALGTYVGRDLAYGTARILSFAGFGMLLISGFGGERFRVGPFALVWLFATALVIGLGLGPILYLMIEENPAAVTQAAGGTALIVAAMGSLGFVLSKDLAAWMRPLSFLVFAAVIVSLVMLLFTSGGNPIISLVILVLSAVLIMVDFNYVRKHATEDDVIWLATGIFVSIVNIFISLLNLSR
ncbi:MAG: US12 family protein [Solirubrobacteraceae bacterium]|nr:US12 family protein [Solirubrobacteraceae bacterium]